MTSIKSLLQIEETFEKTPFGRVIGDKMIYRLRNCLGNPNPNETGYMSCLNCGFVMEEEYFIAGCPNCGCKDVDVFSAQIVKKPV